MQIRKAVIPAAGLGTRFLPVTMSVPKELLPIIDRPLLQYVIAVDIPLEKLLHMVHPASGETAFGRFSRFSYSAFSVALFAVAVILFINGVKSFFTTDFNIWDIDIKEMFEATILLTLSLAIFDLVKAIFEEEVLGQYRRAEHNEIHKTMVRFLGSIIIALAIEALMLVFKFAIIDPEKLVYAVYLIGGVTMLLVGLAYYLRSIGKEADSWKSLVQFLQCAGRFQVSSREMQRCFLSFRWLEESL
jgi:hypothetical protein